MAARCSPWPTRPSAWRRTYGGPVVTVGSDLQFIRPGRPGDIVRASALQISRTRRTGLFQVSISEKAAGVIAAGLFRGRWLSMGLDAELRSLSS